MKNKINLGSGREYKKGWVNVDFNIHCKPDIIHNLDDFPYPFKNNEFNKIRISHVFEHLDKPIKVLEELYRISKNKCQINIRVPYDKHPWGAWGELTHKRPFNSRTFKPLCTKGNNNFNFNFNLKETRFKFICNRKVIQPFISLFNYLINLNLTLTEYFWSRIIPIMEVGFVLEVEK